MKEITKLGLIETINALKNKEFSSVEENLLACDSLKSIQQLCIQTEKAEYLKIRYHVYFPNKIINYY